MTVKSILDIDVNDEQFKRFATLFGKYQDALSKQPQMWANVDKAVDSTDASVNKILAAFMAMGQFHREMNELGDKDNKNLQRKAGLWDRIQKTSTGVLKDVEGIGKWMLKWSGITLGLGIGSLFGLRAIAEDVAADRNKALGLDLNIGQEKAFGLHQGRYFNNPDQLLTGAFTARSNLASPAFQAIASLGINPNQSTVAIANQLLLKLQAMAKSMPQQQLGNLLQEYPGLSGFGVDLQGLERLRNISGGELKQQISEYGPAAEGMRLSDRQGRAFQDFVTSIDTTFAQLTKQVERDLVPLLGPIQKLVGSIGKDISMLLRSKVAAEAIDDFGKAIDRFSGYLASSTFKQDIKDFEDGTRTFLDIIGFAAHVVAHPLDTFKEGAGDLWNAFTSWAKGKEAEAHGGDPNWRESEQVKRQGFISDMRDHVRVGPAAPVRSSAAPAAGPVAANVKISLTNATGANVNMSVNQLNGGVA